MLTAILISALGLAAAAPAPAPRTCGTVVFPSIFQGISEAAPTLVDSNGVAGGNPQFRVQQDVRYGAVADRQWQIVAFEGIPAEATGCALQMNFPADAALTYAVGGDETQSPAMNVSAILPADVTYPNDYSWDLFTGPDSPLASGLFGTVTVHDQMSVTINTGVCAENMGFLFSMAPWVQTSAIVEFDQDETSAEGTSVFLTYNC